MKERKKILIIFGFFYFIFVLLMYFGLRNNLKNKFSDSSLHQMISGKSSFREQTTDLCRYQILGDPKEAGNYVKIDFFCEGGKKSQNTISLSAIEDKTVGGIIKEYARIVGFDETLIDKQNFICYLDGKKLTNEMKKEIIRPTATLTCNK